MQIVTLIFLPWIIYGMLSWLGAFNAAINITISFIVDGLYFAVLYIMSLFTDFEDDEPESAIERARRVIG